MAFLDDQAGLVSSDIARLISVGDIIMSVSNAPRMGFLLCDWSLLDEAVYPELFSVIGHAFDLPGDPAGFFRLPPSGGMSPMGVGSSPGLTTRSLGDMLGEEEHVLTVAELASHNHTQNAHGHTVTDPGHTHAQDPHTHSVNSHVHDMGHNHTQNSHGHTQTAHAHDITFSSTGGGSGIALTSNGVSVGVNASMSLVAPNIQNATATNIAFSGNTGTASPGTDAAIPDIDPNDTGLTVDSSTATNNPEGSDVGHNTIHPVVCWYFYIRFE